jgi:hypothetical protein
MRCVHRAGRFIGSIAERAGGYEAARFTADGLRTERFQDRDVAAAWLAKLAGG